MENRPRQPARNPRRRYPVPEYHQEMMRGLSEREINFISILPQTTAIPIFVLNLLMYNGFDFILLRGMWIRIDSVFRIGYCSVNYGLSFVGMPK